MEIITFEKDGVTYDFSPLPGMTKEEVELLIVGLIRKGITRPAPVANGKLK